MKSALTISRYWNHPKIHTKISSNNIALTIELDDFIEALLQELGPTCVLKPEGFKARCQTFYNGKWWSKSHGYFTGRVHESVQSVLEKIKEESAKVPPPPAIDL